MDILSLKPAWGLWELPLKKKEKKRRNERKKEGKKEREKESKLSLKLSCEEEGSAPRSQACTTMLFENICVLSEH